MTNGDRFRSMSDEQIASKFCYDLRCCDCPIYYKCKKMVEELDDFDILENCKQRIMNWLKQESED